jgi:hypothetical protein
MIMTQLHSLLVVGMFKRTTEKVNGKWTPVYKETVAEAARKLQELLYDGQCLVDDFFHNASWYNKQGEKLGWGDLAKDQVNEIPSLLPPGEVFVLCPESASFWELRNRPDINPMRPGVEWMIANAMVVITPHGIYAPPQRWSAPQPHMSKFNLRGSLSVEARYVDERWFRDLIDVANRTEVDPEKRFVICPVEHPTLVEELLPGRLTVGDNWTCSQPDQKLPDGRWKLFLMDAMLPPGYEVSKTAYGWWQVTGPDFRQTWRTESECIEAAHDHHTTGTAVSVHDLED